MGTTRFQYCQKLVIFSRDMDKVLLAKRKGEADFDGVYSFIGGKMETTDTSILEGMYREKCEEIGENNIISIYLDLVHHELFIKKSGDVMILPHYICIFEEGEIELNEEYSNYEWFDVGSINEVENVIPTVVTIVEKFLNFKDILPKLSKIKLENINK